MTTSTGPARATTRREKQHAAEALATAARQRRRRLLRYGISALALVLAATVTASIVLDRSAVPPALSETPATSAVLAELTHVNVADLDIVALPSAGLLAPPRKITGQPALAIGGKPEILYMGAEYCSLCAAQRWPLVIALAQFGSFVNLRETYSASAPEPFPHTPTLSFHGSSYTSDYLTFTAVEMESNRPSGGSGDYLRLDTPTGAQMALLNTLDVSADGKTSGGIPFIDFGNQYAQVAGANYSPALLAGRTPEQVAAVLGKSPSSEVAQAILGSADVVTAEICAITNGQPGDVCNRAGVENALTGILSSQTGG